MASWTNDPGSATYPYPMSVWDQGLSQNSKPLVGGREILQQNQKLLKASCQEAGSRPAAGQQDMSAPPLRNLLQRVIE
jgi:hypothetical protein